MNRQYIGARYVPKFSNPIEWSATGIYNEPLIIVTYLNNSYTSKKPVPVGSPPTDGEYWALTGAYNAQVAEYRQEVEELKNEIKPLLGIKFYNVKDYGAKGDGVTDDTLAFTECINDCPIGGEVIIPDGNYYLSQTPDPHLKSIIYNIQNTTVFTGKGCESIATGGGGFTFNNITNPWNNVNGTKQTGEMVTPSPIGGGTMLNSTELKAPTYIIESVEGVLTKNQDTIIFNKEIDIAEGSSLSSNLQNFPTWADRASCARIGKKINNTTYKLGIDNGDGGGLITPLFWSYETTKATFKVYPRFWSVGSYIGVETSDIKNIDEINYCANYVANVNANSVNALEIDMNLIGEPEEISRNLFITGIAQSNALTAGADIQMSGDYNFTYGLSVRRSTTGVYLNAYQPIIISQKFQDNETKKDVDIYYGILFDGFGDISTTRPLLAGQQIVDGATCIALTRKTDTSSTGAFIKGFNTDKTQQLFEIDTNGKVSAVEVATATLSLQTLFTEETITPTTTFLIKGGNGKIYKVPCIEA